MKDDTISRQAAIDAMCDACSDWCDEGVCKKVSAIQKLPPAQQWIPVTERLPDKECFVLVSVNDGAIYTDLSLFRHDGRFIEHTGDVIAWQPLPEPYKAEEITAKLAINLQPTCNRHHKQTGGLNND